MVSDKQAISLVGLFMIGGSLILGVGKAAKKDMWLAALIAMLLALLLIIMHVKLSTLFAGKNFFEMLQAIFGKFMGNILVLLYTWFFFHFGALVMDLDGSFINVVGIPETPKIIPMLAFVLICSWGAKEGIEVLGRMAETFIVIILLFIAVLMLLASPRMDFHHSQPMLYHGFGPVWKGAYAAVGVPFGQIFIFLVFVSSFQPKSALKIALGGWFLTGLAVLGIVLMQLWTLGVVMIESSYFPTYEAASRIHIGDFIQRLEIIVSTTLLLTSFMKVSMCIIAAAKGVALVFRLKDYRFVVFPIGFLMLHVAYSSFENVIEMMEWIKKVVPNYFNLFLVILPVFIYLVGEIKVWWKNSHGSSQ